VPGLGITIEVAKGDGTGATAFAGYLRHLHGLTAGAQDMAPALELVHKQFLATEKGIFASSGGGKWQPLTQKYLMRKTREGFDPRIERRTGDLARALTTGRGPGAVNVITPDEAIFGTNLKQAVFAQRGSGRRRRRLVTIDARRRSRWVATVRDYLLHQNPGGSP
jgi:phage gpG-like protein